MATKRGRGRPSGFKKEFAEQARKLCLLGATDVEVANFFEVSTQTIDNWKVKHPEFFGALKAGKKEADDRVVRSLYQRAVGYSHPETKFFQNAGEVITAETMKHYPPDTTACIFWLKNRDKENWRDKVEHGGDPDNPIEHRMSIDITGGRIPGAK